MRFIHTNNRRQVAGILLSLVFAFSLNTPAFSQRATHATESDDEKSHSYTRTSFWLGASRGVSQFTPQASLDVLLGKRKNILVGLQYLHVMDIGHGVLDPTATPFGIKAGWVSTPESRNHFEASTFVGFDLFQPMLLYLGYKRDSKGPFAFRLGLAFSRYDSYGISPELHFVTGYRFRNYRPVKSPDTLQHTAPGMTAARPPFYLYASGVYVGGDAGGALTVNYERLFRKDPRFSYTFALGVVFASRPLPQFGGGLSWITRPEKKGHFVLGLRLCPGPRLLLAYRYTGDEGLFLQVGATLLPSAWTIVFPGPTISIGFTK